MKRSARSRIGRVIIMSRCSSVPGPPKARRAFRTGSTRMRTSIARSSGASSTARRGTTSASRPSCPSRGSFVTTFVGEMPVVVARDPQGALHAFENRCAHRGALICMQARGTRRALQLHLSQLDLRPRRQPHQRGVPQGHRRQGRHAGGCAAGDRRRRKKIQRRNVQGPGLRHAIARTRRRSRTTSAPRSCRA